MNDYLVLIVEDNEKNMKLARDLLRFKGFRTVEAANGQDALALAAESCPDVVLMDIQLPDLDGQEVLRRLRADPLTSGLTVVALTAFAMREDRERLQDLGFQGYISKPIDVKRFPDCVRAYCAAPREGN